VAQPALTDRLNNGRGGTQTHTTARSEATDVNSDGIHALDIRRRTGWRLIQYVWLGALLLLVAVPVPSARGQDSPTPDQGEGATASEPSESVHWEVHMQSTVVAQGHPSFPAEYTGANSMTPGASVRETISVDVTGGVRLWRGGELFGDALMWQGYGLNNSLGLAGFSSGEAYRIGKTYPDANLCRAYLRETIGFGGG